MNFKEKGYIVSFESKSGYLCKGILYYNAENKKTIIHIHGSYGNFYDNNFIQQMAKEYNYEGFNLLAFNLQTHGGFSDGFINNEYCYVGGAVSSFETSVADIKGAIEYVSEFSENVILQGHSLGTDKILNYLIKTGENYPIILLSPCDSYALQEKWIAPETVEKQVERIRQLPSGMFDFLDLKEYGVNSGKEKYYIPITKEAFLSLADGFNFNYSRIEEEGIVYHIDVKAFIYIGGNDSYQTSSIDKVGRFFESRVKEPYLFYHKDGDHDLGGCSDEVIVEIIRWLKNL